MEKTVYVIYNYKENRPVISFNNYGNILVYLTEEAAQAYIARQKELGAPESLFSIKVCRLN